MSDVCKWPNDFMKTYQIWYAYWLEIEEYFNVKKIVPHKKRGFSLTMNWEKLQNLTNTEFKFPKINRKIKKLFVLLK